MSDFYAHHPPAVETVRDDAGAARILDGLESAGAALRGRSNEALVRVLGRAGARFLDPGDPLRVEAVEEIARDAGLSSATARLVVDRMAEDWTPDPLARLLRAEFGDPAVLEGFRPGPEGDLVRALGDPLAFHVGAGNVPGVGATSILRSLLVRTPLLMKPGRGDRVLPVLLARAIEEEDAEVGRAVAVSYWPGGSGPPLESAALGRAHRVVVYGGSDTVEALAARLPATTPLIAYRHRISVAAVGREALGSEQEARRVARSAAVAVATYDQRGCVSPHVVWVEEKGELAPLRWAGLLADELARVAVELPPGRPDTRTASGIQQLRGAAELGAAAGRGGRLFAPDDLSWTVVYEVEARLEPGCAGRSVRVQPIPDLGVIPELVRPWRDALQSVSVEAPPARRVAVAADLARAGVSRVTTLARQPWPRPWWTHDGQGPLRVLVRWSTLEG